MSEALQCYICHVWTSLTTNHLCSRCYSDSRKIDHLIETLKKRDDENSALRVQLVQAQAEIAQLKTLYEADMGRTLPEVER